MCIGRFIFRLALVFEMINVKTKTITQVLAQMNDLVHLQVHLQVHRQVVGQVGWMGLEPVDVQVWGQVKEQVYTQANTGD